MAKAYEPMKIRFFPLIAILFAPGMASAADVPRRDCALQRDLIFEMTQAEYGSYNVWDAQLGEMNTDERFSSAVVQESGNVVAVGDITSFGKPDRIVKIAEYDHRGRVVWETAHPITGLLSSKKILFTPNGFLVLGTTADKNSRLSTWLGFFDKQGNLTSQKSISGKISLAPEDIVLQTSGKGYILSASLGEEKSGVFHGVIYHLDEKGNVTDDHSYLPGLDNRIFSLVPYDKDYFLASGYLRGDDGRITGWLLKLNKDGSLVWQQQYPRGVSAQINKTVAFVGTSVIAVGETKPAGGGNTAAWVMKLDGDSGAMEWQRYYTAQMNQASLDVLVNGDHLASVMVQATRPAGSEPNEDNEDFVRLLTINQRGVLFMSDEYFNGTGAQGFQLTGGRAGERIISGRTDIVYKVDPKPGEPVETLVHGWDALLVAAAPMEEFPDPCLNVNPFAP
jgi:outer membrane protein assembly factor BamB